VVPADIHEFFEASAGVAGALIGLLFVAISVAGDRLNRSEAPAQLHRIRAAAALAAFTNSLTISLWSLIPTEQIGVPAVVVASGGLLFVAASMLSLIRLHAVRATARDATFLLLFLVTFGLQFAAGVDLDVKTNDPSMVENLAILVFICFLLGIWRSWDLIGGPSIGFRQELTALVRAEAAAAKSTETEKTEAPPPPD
jgi:hypothetical protein